MHDRKTMITAGTKLCCLIGDPVEHSLSPAIHNAGYLALGLDYVYLAFRVADAGAAVGAIRALGIRGASVTVPHKVAVVSELDELAESAERMGAVNTIVNQDGRLVGYNTDGEGAVRALEEKLDLEGLRVVIVGAGGAARAVAWALSDYHVRLTILNRTEKRARRLADELDAHAGGLGELERPADADILVQATSVGMSPDRESTIVPERYLHPELTVFDIVYNPEETRLIREAREKACLIVYGYKMLLYQAIAQFELFTGHEAPVRIMEAELINRLNRGGTR